MDNLTTFGQSDPILQRYPYNQPEKLDNEIMHVMSAGGAPPTADWLHGYYHHAINLWVRRFLQSNGICGRTLFIYFVDDVSSDGNGVPTQERWNAAINTMERHLG